MDAQLLRTEVENTELAVEHYLKQREAFAGWLGDALVGIRTTVNRYALVSREMVGAEILATDRGGVAFAISTPDGRVYAALSFDPGRWGIDLRRTVRIADYADGSEDDVDAGTLGTDQVGEFHVVNAIEAFLRAFKDKLAAGGPPPPRSA